MYPDAGKTGGEMCPTQSKYVLSASLNTLNIALNNRLPNCASKTLNICLPSPTQSVILHKHRHPRSAKLFSAHPRWSQKHFRCTLTVTVRTKRSGFTESRPYF